MTTKYKMRELDGIDSMSIEMINNTDETISALADQLLKMQHSFLRKNGWEIFCAKIGPSETCFYKKGEETFICEYDAMDHELYGQ